MKQEKIRYRDIMDLGFKEKVEHDQQFIDDYGYDYTIITLKLTKRIYLMWEKETQLASIHRTDKEDFEIRRMDIKNLEQLKYIIDFFLGEPVDNSKSSDEDTGIYCFD